MAIRAVQFTLILWFQSRDSSVFGALVGKSLFGAVLRTTTFGSDFISSSIAHNEHADHAARAANSFRSDVSRVNQQVLVTRFGSLQKQQSSLLALQRAATASSKHAARPSWQAPVRPPRDCFQLAMERMGMLQNDCGVPMPNAGISFPLPNFCGLLFSQQEWVSEPDGCSLAELYVLFILNTGWCVPQSISSMAQLGRPVYLRRSLASKLGRMRVSCPHFFSHGMSLRSRSLPFVTLCRCSFPWYSFPGR